MEHLNVTLLGVAPALHVRLAMLERNKRSSLFCLFVNDKQFFYIIGTFCSGSLSSMSHFVSPPLKK